MRPTLAEWLSAVRGRGSLGAKLVVMLTGIGLAGALAITALLAAVITPNFNRLEEQAVEAHIERTRAALSEYASKVESAVRDYGDWNQSYDYMAHPTAAFERESFSPLAMANLDVNGMAYVAPDGHVVIARWRDLRRGGDMPALRQGFVDQIAHADFVRILGASNSGRYFARIGPLIAAIGVAQVRRSDGSGTPRGLVLMARQITSQQLSDLLQLRAGLDLANAGDDARISPTSGSLRIAVPITGADGHAVASAAFSVPRDISTLGRRMLVLAVIGTTILLLIVLFMLRRMIARLVLAPLARVERHMQTVRSSGAPHPLEEERRDDEIGSLGRSFNAMLRQLKDLNEQVEVQSFELGKSESAVAVMHNVRNALNPISTILSQGINQAPPVDAATLARALAELTRSDLPTARRDKLLAFVQAALDAEARARDDRRAQLQIGREAMVHVLEIIGQQQRQAHGRPDVAVCDATDLVAQNATIARYSAELSIAFSFPARPHLVLANRIILSQVIGNCFSNAAEAIAAGGDGGTIDVAITENGGRTRIAIRDSGEGFDPGDAPRLFQRGFSTREHKSGGLGLHWCANSMVAMGGSLSLESEGIGRGAVAVLTLDSAPAAEATLAA